MPEFGQTAGIRLLIHEQNKMPFPDENGITAIPGSMTILAIKQVKINDNNDNDSNNDDGDNDDDDDKNNVVTNTVIIMTIIIINHHHH